MSKKRNCKTLSLGEKVDLIKAVQCSGKKKKDIAADFGIPPNTLSTIIKNKDYVLRAAQGSSFGHHRKRLRTSSYPFLEGEMLKWLKYAKSNSLPVNGVILREKAEWFAMQLGITDFKASSGWLTKFKNRNVVVQKAISKVRVAVSEVDCDQWGKEVMAQQLIEDYDPLDIFNAGETSMLYKALPDETRSFKAEVIIKSEGEEGGTDEDECVTSMLPPTVCDAIRAMETVKSYIMSQPNVSDDIFQSMSTIHNFCTFNERNNMKQPKITQFFHKT